MRWVLVSGLSHDWPVCIVFEFQVTSRCLDWLMSCQFALDRLESFQLLSKSFGLFPLRTKIQRFPYMIKGPF